MKRTEYPRPQFVRREWQCLNGSWEFSFDDENRAQAEHWELDSFRPEGRIEVPFCFESKLSGIGDTSIHDHVFYKEISLCRRNGRAEGFCCILRRSITPAAFL